MERKRSIRDSFMEALIGLAQNDDRIWVIDPDVGSATRTWNFGKKFPDRFVETGIAEQNAFGIASGLASTDKTVFISTFAVFASMRACEMIRTSICYPKRNVKIIGGYAGLSNGKDGATHQSVEDFAIMRSIPNLVVCSVSDSEMAEKIVPALAQYNGPVYVRMEYENVYDVHGPELEKFEFGKAYKVKSGSDVTIVTSGTALHRALAAVATTAVSAEVLDMATIKPLDTKALDESLKKTGKLIVLEDHSVIGGLFSAISEHLVESGMSVDVIKLGIKDTFTESGKAEELLDKYEIGESSVAKAINKILHKG